MAFLMNDCAILVTGLPASGKSTVGRRLADELSWSFLDKDDFLEALFEEQGVGDANWRRRLSIEADKRFERAALKQEKVVLVSHWRPGGRTDTGTPTLELLQKFATVVEVYCDCVPEIAAHRFANRTRHAGHLDDLKSKEHILAWMHDLRDGYPIFDGPVIRVSTAKNIEIEKVADEVRALGI